MRKSLSFLLLGAIAFSVSVSAKAPPGHEAAKESKSILCPSFVYAPSADLTTTVYPLYMGSVCYEIIYTEPVRNWQYVDVLPPLYRAPHVEKPQAFYARSSC